MALILQQSSFLLFLQLHASLDELCSQDNSAHHLKHGAFEDKDTRNVFAKQF